jgi:flagellar biosynthesis/type III secretory pathway protein FliH
MSYVFVELPKFTKELENLKTAEDYWIFTMKNATHMREVPKGAPKEIKQAYEILEKHTWTEPERRAYEKAKIALMDDLDAIRTTKEEGRAEGEQIGIEKGRAEAAKEIEKLKKDE